MEFELIQEKFAEIACFTYAMENMAYHTAVVLGIYEIQIMLLRLL
jgi:hypothetical protein